MDEGVKHALPAANTAARANNITNVFFMAENFTNERCGDLIYSQSR